ncbi:hydroxyisourate hydrolase [Aestuariibacter sp. A3R04]|uniref:hydroxyisourate hydrolase n=1 Tax=Aestuariibacter sp. A3R04 TaxID=2841571 RepID=UPI001C0868D8|nr:hydroxyisourate hydrolase [Aestuariibacter sp. A3R04]MBU3022623.1 hydroxyisourate hydrolase [Aestuariibacter sp. A3R04]
MISLSSHVLDTTSGKPAANLPLTLTTPDGNQYQGVTDDDGRCKSWQNATLIAGTYQLRFHCHEYLTTKHGESFYPHVDIAFVMEENGGHYHVPLLISPFGFSSYRGS